MMMMMMMLLFSQNTFVAIVFPPPDDDPLRGYYKSNSLLNIDPSDMVIRKGKVGKISNVKLYNYV